MKQCIYLLGQCVRYSRLAPLTGFHRISACISSSSRQYIKARDPEWGSKREKEKRSSILRNLTKMDPQIEAVLAPFRASVKEQVITSILHVDVYLIHTDYLLENIPRKLVVLQYSFYMF